MSQAGREGERGLLEGKVRWLDRKPGTIMAAIIVRIAGVIIILLLLLLSRECKGKRRTREAEDGQPGWRYVLHRHWRAQLWSKGMERVGHYNSPASTTFPHRGLRLVTSVVSMSNPSRVHTLASVGAGVSPSNHDRQDSPSSCENN